MSDDNWPGNSIRTVIFRPLATKKRRRKVPPQHQLETIIELGCLYDGNRSE